MTTPAALALGTFVRRLVGAAALDPRAYEDVEADRRATVESGVVVALSSLAAGIGARGLGAATLTDVAFFTLLALALWVGWALLTYHIGARILPEAATEATLGQLLRTLGFATAPGILRVIGVWPGMTIPIYVLTAVWMLLAMIVALQQALDYRHARRAVAVAVLGWLLTVAFAVVIGLLFGPALATSR
jgi:hypothetical protein